MPSNNLPIETMLARVQKSADLAKEIGYGALTGSDAFWAIETVERLKGELALLTAERDRFHVTLLRIEEIASRPSLATEERCSAIWQWVVQALHFGSTASETN